MIIKTADTVVICCNAFSDLVDVFLIYDDVTRIMMFLLLGNVIRIVIVDEHII